MQTPTPISNGPKVCFACAMPHVRYVEDEVVTPDGRIVFSKSCLELPGAQEKFAKYFVKEGQ